MPTKKYPNTAITPAFSAIIANTPGSIPAASTAILTLTTTQKSAVPSYMYLVTCPNLDAGLIIGEAFSDAVGTVKVKIANVTVGAVNSATPKNFNVLAF